MKRLFSLLLSIILLFVILITTFTAASESATAQLQEMYAQGELLMAQGDYAGAAAQFETLGAYSDASQMAMYCKGIMAAESLGMYDVAISAFQGLGDFKDSKQLLTYYQGRSYQAAADVLVESEVRYDLVNARDMYDEAAKVYSGLALFKDCLTRLSACQSGSDKAQEKINTYDYATADKLEKDGKLEEALETFKALGSYSDSAERAKGVQEKIYARDYAAADKLEQAAKYKEAIEAFKALGNYSDSAERASRIADKHKFEIIGNIVAFGTYEQDNNISNGAEPIEWIVLDVQDRKTLIISRYVLDIHDYNTTNKDITWENCTLRSWLNKDFLTRAFSSEIDAIMTTNVNNSNSQGYIGRGTNGGNNTQDKIFLLSHAEAQRYFAYDADRKCSPTRYALNQMALYYNTKPDTNSVSTISVDWWLRSPGYAQNFAAFVKADGSCYSGFVLNTDYVRPALWIDLDAEFFSEQ